MSGQRLWTLGHRSTKNCPGVIGEVPMRMTRSSPPALLARSTDALQYRMMYRASLYSDLPASVSTRPRWVRVNSVSPSELSSRFTCLTTAVGVMYSVAAALLKLPASATHKKVSSCGLYIMVCTLPASINLRVYCSAQRPAWQEDTPLRRIFTFCAPCRAGGFGFAMQKAPAVRFSALRGLALACSG